jgi:hypothetical protein
MRTSALALDESTGSPLDAWLEQPTRQGAERTTERAAPLPYIYRDTDTADPNDVRAYVFRWNDTGDALGGLGGMVSQGSAIYDKASTLGSGDMGSTIKTGAELAKAGAGLAGKGSKAGRVLEATGKGALLGLSIGAAVGTVFPGIGTAIGTVIGGAVGAIGGFFSTIFSEDDPKPTPAWMIAVMEDAKRCARLPETDPAWNPLKSVDCVLMVSGRVDYQAAKAAGTLPSQVWARNRAAAAAKGKKLDQNHGAAIRAELAKYTPGEAALVSAAMTTGHSVDVAKALGDIRTAQAKRRKLVFPASMFSGRGPGMAPMTPAKTLPRPAFHIPISPMPFELHVYLLRQVPMLQALPEATRAEMSGLGSKARDVSGVDAVSREFVLWPGQTLAGAAEDLTGDPNRAREFVAANPDWDGSSARVAIPPGMLDFVDGFTAAKTRDDTSDPNIEGDRQNITARVWVLKDGEFPGKMASMAGANPARVKWFKELHDANPHKPLTEDRQNFVFWPAGEMVNYPDAWPAHVRAVPAPASSPIPGVPGLGGLPIPPGTPTIPAAGTMDAGVIVKAQGIAALWAKRHPEAARPQDFGQTVADGTGTITPRFTQVLSSFQLWWVATTRQPLRVDGVLDPATDQALGAFLQQDATQNGGILGQLGSMIPGGLGGLPGGSPVPGAPQGSGGAVPGVTPILTGPPAQPIPIGPISFGTPGSGGAVPGVTPILTGPPAQPIPVGPISFPGNPPADGGSGPAIGALAIVGALLSGMVK